MISFLAIVCAVCYIAGLYQLANTIGVEPLNVLQQQVVYQKMLLGVVLLALGVVFTVACWACSLIAPPKPLRDPPKPSGNDADLAAIANRAGVAAWMVRSMTQG